MICIKISPEVRPALSCYVALIARSWPNDLNIPLIKRRNISKRVRLYEKPLGDIAIRYIRRLTKANKKLPVDWKEAIREWCTSFNDLTITVIKEKNNAAKTLHTIPRMNVLY
jgi:hypothetical protein